MMFCTWVRSVLGVMNSRSQISGVREALGQRAQHLQLARRQRLDRAAGRPGGRAPRRRAARSPRSRTRGSSVAPAFAARTVAHDVLDRPVLGEVAVGAGLDRLEDRLVVVDRREHHDPAGGPARLDRRASPRRRSRRAGGSPSAPRRPARAPAILASPRSCAFPTISMSGSCAEDAGERPEDQAVVVDQQHADRARGRRARGGRSCAARQRCRPPGGPQATRRCHVSSRAGPKAASRRAGRSGSLTPRPATLPLIIWRMRIAFLGLGLIGGSIARAAARRRGVVGAELVAWTPSGAGRGCARAAGVDRRRGRRAERAVEGADLVVLAGAAARLPRARRRLGGDWRASLGTGATVTDVASTKAAITAAAARRSGVRFVGGHPMAGREVDRLRGGGCRAVPGPAVGGHGGRRTAGTRVAVRPRSRGVRRPRRRAGRGAARPAGRGDQPPAAASCRRRSSRRSRDRHGSQPRRLAATPRRSPPAAGAT